MASGDNSNCTSPRFEKNATTTTLQNVSGEGVDQINSVNKITLQEIDEKEIKMKERISQCKNIIESLKSQLNEEKEKNKNEQKPLTEPMNYLAGYYKNKPDLLAEECGNSSYTASVDSKLHCDENLIEYEKQLQKYQNTLNMAQHEKKNAIRKQMLAKAFKLKLMEVENQCNIELLRVKQSLQCIEPLQMIASKWNTNAEDNIYDINSFELMPDYPEMLVPLGSDINNYNTHALVVKNATENSASSSNDDFNI